MLDDGKISAYFGDRSILLFLIKDSKAPEKLRLADDYLMSSPMRWRCRAATATSASQSIAPSATSIAPAK